MSISQQQYQIHYSGSNLEPTAIYLITNCHYSKSARSQKPIHVFNLLDRRGDIIGVAIYGQPMSRNTSKSALELRRFCLIDDTPRNTESWFLAQTLQWLRKNQDEYDHVVTFADPNHGHKGTIYKATNFKYDGLENNNPRVVVFSNGDQAHIREYYQKSSDGEYNNKARKLQESVSKGEARIVAQERKHRFIYEL